MFARLIESTGATVRSQGSMYKAVAQSVLLYCSEGWLVTGEMIKVLTTFHHRLVQHISGITEKRGAGVE